MNCPECGTAMRSMFKYYVNNELASEDFLCITCLKYGKADYPAKTSYQES